MDCRAALAMTWEGARDNGKNWNLTLIISKIEI
jgi:hypothetical protein